MWGIDTTQLDLRSNFHALSHTTHIHSFLSSHDSLLSFKSPIACLLHCFHKPHPLFLFCSLIKISTSSPTRSHLSLVLFIYFWVQFESNSMASTSTPQMELANAFDEIAPSPSSSSKRLKKLPYDVFLNHRGPDVKQTLARDFYNTLNEMGLRVFLDTEELESGDFLPREITEAMRSASLHIAIFSIRYAESPWCLAELSFMLKTGTPIVSVFYHVQPTDLRWVGKGKGEYNPAFSQHENNGRYTAEKLQEWKKALYEVSFYHGHIISNKDDEVRLLKNIVNIVCKVVKDVPLLVAKHPVGLDEVVKDFERTTLQSVQLSHPNVQIVGIWGMGGSGKTTLARQIYNNKFSYMERSSFLFDVRDADSKSVLHKKQIKLLEDLGVKGVSFDSAEEGKGFLARRLRSVRVLIILDDVDHMDQLDALLPKIDSLGSGSLIIVTTRELEVLRCWGISSIYKMRKLVQFHAEQLFCWHAFLQPFPLHGFEELVKRFLIACNGLPLSLKVFGAQLYGNSRKDYWDSQLDKLSRVLHKDVKQSLRVSYDALDDEEKEIFLDTACFFIGEERNLAIDVWDGSGWSGLHSWERLVNKCLVELGEDNLIRMHDHLRDLGREIASQQSPHRLWRPEQISNVQNQLAEKRIDIRGVMAATAGSTSEVQEALHDLAASSLGLQIFVARGRYSNQVNYKLVSRGLVWLSCFEFGQRSLPSRLSLKNLRVLELSRADHLEGLWQSDDDAPVQLRQLTVSRCKKFQTIPKSIARLRHLKKMVLYGPAIVRSLPEEICLLQSLEHLQLYQCNKVSSLPRRFGDLTNLRHLELVMCSELRMLPMSFKQLTVLNHLSLMGCGKLTINSDILENMTKLEYLSFGRCSILEELPRHITNQVSLRELYLKGTSIRELPNNIGELSKLRVMEIGSELLTRLPTSLGNLSSLTNLTITECPNLESLPDSFGCLNQLRDLSIWDAGVKYLPKSARKLINLQALEIWDCSVSELNFGPQLLSSSLCNLKKIHLNGTEVSKISISEDCCPGLENLQLWNNGHLTEIESLPKTVKDMSLNDCDNVKNIRGIGDLVNLQSLIISSCPELGELPSFAELASLKEFELKGCYKVEKIEGVEHCRSLEKLIVDTWWRMSGIESLEHMERLARLHLQTYKRSAVESCIQMIQKWPEEIIICTRAVPTAGSLVSAFTFPNLSVVDSLANKKLGVYPRPRLVQEGSSCNADATIVCFVMNCVASFMGVIICGCDACDRQPTYEFSQGKMEVDEGKWVWMGVFTQRSTYAWLTSKWYEIEGRDEVEKGVLMMGEEKSVVEAFHILLGLLGN